MRKPALLVLAVLAVLLALAAPVAAQRTNASIRGTVTDTGGAAVADAEVSLVGPATGYARATTTDKGGVFVFGDVPAGLYDITVSHAGFTSAVVQGLQLNVADVRRLEVQLAAGGDIKEEITVTAPVVQVETIGAEVSGLVTGEQVRELPLNGRNFVGLTLLMPGVSAPENFDTKDKGLMTGSDMSISGGGFTSNLWTVDGANNNDVGSNRTILVYPSIDSIEEFKIHRNAYGPEIGGASGGQINLITRSGNNDWKASAYFFRRDDAFNEKNFFLKEAGQDKEKLSLSDYGYTLGGPILRDKLYVFASQEWTDETRGTVRTALVPTDLERRGDFSQSANRPTDPLNVINGVQQPFPGNVIPADRLSPAGLLFLQLYARANVNAPAGVNNWVESIDTPITWAQRNVRFDYDLNVRSRVMFRYTQDKWVNGDPNSQRMWGDDPFPAVDSSWDQPGRSVVGQLSQTFGNSAVNTVTASYSGNKIDIAPGGTNAGLRGQVNAAIPSFFPASGRLTNNQPPPTFWGGQGYGALWSMAEWHNHQDLQVLKDDYQGVFGNHWLKGGFLYSDNVKDEWFASNAETQTNLWGAAGLNGWGGGTTGNVLADFLLRDMTWGFGELAKNTNVQQAWNDYEAYLGDSWQLGSGMTLDLGLRYSYYKNPVEDNNQYASFNPDRFTPGLASACNGLMLPPGSTQCTSRGLAGGSFGPNRSLVNEDKNNLAPRLGFAWDVFGNGKSALRLGFGQFYQRERLSPWLLFAQNLFNPSIDGLRYLDRADGPDLARHDSGRPFNGYELDRQTPYNYQANLTWEQRLLTETTLEVSLVGSRGVHLMRRVDINQVRVGDRNGNGISDRLEYIHCGDSNDCQAALRPYGIVTGDNTINFWRNDGTSEYKSLQTQLNSRFGRGSQFQASYTWSQLDANDPLNDSAGSIQPVAITDLSNLGLDKGRAAANREHVFNSSVVWHAPSFENRGKAFSTIFGNWSIGGIVFYASGVPLTVFNGAVPGVPGGPAGTGYEGNQRPLRVAGQPCHAKGGRKEQILNPRGWTLVGYQLGTTNQMSERGECDGPDFFEVDLSFYKNIRFGGRLDGQFRLEIFNVTNETNFIGVNTSLNPVSVTHDGQNGEISSATRITGERLPLNFGQATGTRDPRQIQLGIKLFFD